MTKEMLTEYEMTRLSITEQFEELSIAVKYADKLHGAIRRKMYAEGFEEGRKAGRNEAEEKSIEGRVKRRKKVFAKSRQERRDEIVEQAKRDVVSQFIWGDGVGKVVYGVCGHNTVEFIVNKEKRTVVALLRLAYVEYDVVAKGIAKCDPSDCFNVHVGKAIALRRALGLEVPVEYINTPQPTEVREGDVVKIYLDDGDIEINEVLRKSDYNEHGIELTGRFITDVREAFFGDKPFAEIIDDTREEDV